MLSKQDAIEKMQEKIGRIDVPKGMKRFSPDFKKWQRDSEIAIQNTFDENSRHVADFKAVR